MGYRSTLITEHLHTNPPNWFKEKYSEKLHFFESGVIASKIEFKIYDDEIFKDFQKFLNETDFFEKNYYSKMTGYEIAILHDDGKISKVLIFDNKIIYETYMEGNEDDFLPVD